MARNNPFSQEISFEYGVAAALSPLVRRFVAHNPGPLTFKGTNVYVLGRGELALIDPGPDDEAHVQSLLAVLNGERVTRIFLTHSHKDHCGALDRLQHLTGAKSFGFCNPDVVRGAFVCDENTAETDANGLVVSFVDSSFRPDIVLRDGDEVQGQGWTLRAVHTPGHAPDHLCYALLEEKTLFTGDHIMPWSTSVIAPPEGQLGDYMNSLNELSKRDDELYFPGHGGRVHHPKRLLRAYVLHRQWREKSILQAVSEGKTRVEEILPLIYHELEEGLRVAASLSVLSHLLFLAEKGRLKQTGGEGFRARFVANSSNNNRA